MTTAAPIGAPVEAGDAAQAEPATQVVSLADALLQRWYRDPALFAWEVFGVRLWQRQRLICRLIAKAADGPVRIAVKSGHKIGKALALDTPIPTPTGWTTMGDIRVGDVVFDERGKPCNVVGVTPVMHERPCYDVEFSDGTVITADEEHEWLTWDAAARRAHLRAKAPRSGPKVVTTGQIRDTLNSNSRGRNHAIKNCAPIECADADLPLDPYVLGVWLGDGHSRSPYITSADVEIIDELRSLGADVGEARDFTSTGKAKLYPILQYRGRRTRTILRELGVFGNKHVPAAYLRASAPQRLALLQGLLDTDGSVARNGSVEFCNTNRRLADAVYELAASLGLKPFLKAGRAMLRGKDCGEKYRVTFTPHTPVFRLPRKLARQHCGKTKATWVRQREIVAVRPRPSVPVRCIEVDSPSHLYLASRAFIPTHNSLTLAVVAIWFAVTRRAGRVIITAPTGRQIRDTLWREVKRLYGLAREKLFRNFAIDDGLGGKLNQIPDAGYRFPDGSEIIGFSTNQPERMAGTSGEHLLYLIDEASGVSAEIFTAIEGNRAGDASVIMFSNPTQTSGYFYDAFHGKNASSWHRVTVSSEDTPNARSGTKQVPGLATRGYILEKRQEWGPDYENDIRYQVRILGVFPRSASNQVVPLVRIEAGKGVWYAFAAQFLGREDKAYEPRKWREIIHTAAELYQVQEAWAKSAEGPLVLGIDPAWEGEDYTVIRPRRGKRMFPAERFKHGDGEDIALEVDRIIAQYRRGPDEVPRVLVDAIGVGVATVEALRKRPTVRLVEVNSSRAATEPDEYRNLRGEILFAATRFLKDGGGFEPDPDLERDLAAATYTIDGLGRIEVEQKKAIKKRLGRSPDDGDAFSLAAFDGTIAKARVLPMSRVPQGTLRLGGRNRPRGFG